jgi:hypothetical protein
MNRVRSILVLGLLAALGVVSARADLARPATQNPGPAAASATTAEFPASVVVDNHGALDEVSWLLNRQAREVSPLAMPLRSVPRPTEADRESVATPLSPGPNGFALGLSALTSLAAFQACRSFRKLNLSTLPEWYHTGGPAQVGHATPYQLDYVPLAVCDFEQPSDLRPGISYRIPRELRSRLLPQFFLIVESPRGPPAQS